MTNDPRLVHLKQQVEALIAGRSWLERIARSLDNVSVYNGWPIAVCSDAARECMRLSRCLDLEIEDMLQTARQIKAQQQVAN